MLEGREGFDLIMDRSSLERIVIIPFQMKMHERVRFI